MRALLYFLAAELFQQPDHERVVRLRRVVAQVLESGIESQPWRPLLTDIAGHLLLFDDEWAPAYTRLFVLGVPRVAAQPFGSCWLESDQQAMGRTTVAVRQLMADHGIAAGSGLLPDHIASELAFMAWLIANEGAADTVVATRDRLLHEHLVRWVPRFTLALRAADPPTLYLLAAELVDRLLAEDTGIPHPSPPPARRTPVSPELSEERFE